MQQNVLLNLSAKSLTNEDIPQVIETLSKDSGINQLDLSNNLIKDEGIKKLVTSPAFRHIFYFNLYSNCIGDEGAVAVVNSSKINSIASLNLAKNCITTHGFISLAKQLPGTKIVNLDLIFNPGSNDPRSVNAILEAAKQHRILQYLHLPTEFNTKIRPVLLNNRHHVSTSKQQLISVLRDLEELDSLEYPVSSLTLENLVQFEEIYYNQMLNSPLKEKNNIVTCRKIQNYIGDNYFQITKVVEKNIECDSSVGITLCNLPSEIISRITKCCKITDVNIQRSRTLSKRNLCLQFSLL